MTNEEIATIDSGETWLHRYVALCKSFARYAPEYAAEHHRWGHGGEVGEIKNLICKRIRQMPYDERYESALDNPAFIDMGFDGDLLLEAGDVLHYTCLQLPEESLAACADRHARMANDYVPATVRNNAVITRAVRTIGISIMPGVFRAAAQVGAHEYVAGHFCRAAFALQDLTDCEVIEIASINIDKLSRRYQSVNQNAVAVKEAKNGS